MSSVLCSGVGTIVDVGNPIINMFSELFGSADKMSHPSGSEVKYVLKDFATGHLLLEKRYSKDCKDNRYDFVQLFSMQDLDYRDADVFKFLSMQNTKYLYVKGFK